MSESLTAAGTRTGTLASALAAAAMLAVGMGFGRFAFTGLYPAMLRDGLLSLNAGSFAASANYAGYLLGALLISRAPERRAGGICRLALLGSVACLATMAVDGGAWFAIVVRLLAGVFSALAMVGAASWLLQAMGQPQGAPLLFAGVGLGICLSAELIAAGNSAAWRSSASWLLLAAAALALSTLAWPALADRPIQSGAGPSNHSLSVHAELGAGRLVPIYGLAGFGYIITATYLPVLVGDARGTLDPVHVWALFGLGAAPSCFIWHRVHEGLGTRRALALNLLIQSLGVALPALSHTAAAYLGSAVLVGGTFMGTATIAMPAARRLAARVRFKMLASMTASYAVGQIVGPLLASSLFSLNQSFAPALLAAAAALLVASALCLPGAQRMGA